jgi:phosphoribosylformylglycinamidine cyclo-ligase
VLKLVRKIAVRGLAHVTGGGLVENVPRILPPRLAARLERTAWPLPPLFRWLKEQGNIAERELYRVFNCGIGMVVIVDPAQERAAVRILKGAGETVWRIGRIVKREKNAPQVTIV